MEKVSLNKFTQVANFDYIEEPKLILSVVRKIYRTPPGVFSLPFLSNENFPFSRKIQAKKLPSASGFYDRRSAKGFIQGK